jgi:uncharacterized membrane protein
VDTQQREEARKPGDGDGEPDSQEQQPGRREGKAPGGRGARVKNAHIIEEFINVGVPHDVVFDQWTQYDDWSKIFKKESGQKGAGKDGDDDRHVAVTAKIGPSRRQWQAEVVRVVPGRRLEWEAKGGIQAKGVTTFHQLDDRLTHLQVVVQYRPSGFMETMGNFLRMPRRRVRKDLKLFKHYVELRGEATGKGPGEIGDGGLRKGVDDQVRSVREGSEDGDRSAEHGGDQPSDQADDHATDQADDQATNQAGDHADEHPDDQSTGESAERGD